MHIRLDRRPRTRHIRVTTVIASRLSHRLRTTITRSLVRVRGSTGGRRDALGLGLLDLLHGGKAVVFAVDGGQKVHDEAGDEEDVDERDDPFEDGGCVPDAFCVADAETCGKEDCVSDDQAEEKRIGPLGRGGTYQLLGRLRR